MYHQKSCESCFSVHWLEIMLVKSPLLQLFDKHFEHFMICFFPSCWAECPLPKSQEGYAFRCCSSESSIHVCCLFTRLSYPQPTMHSTADYGSWFRPKMCSSSAADVDQEWITFISYHKQTVPGFICNQTETTSSNRSLSTPEFDSVLSVGGYTPVCSTPNSRCYSLAYRDCSR